jgi:hypothetical protein
MKSLNSKTYSSTILMSTFLAVMFLFTMSCEKELELKDSDPTREIVVNGVVPANDSIQLQIFRTSGVLTPDTACPLTNATVSMYVNDIALGQFLHNGHGVYTGDNRKFKPGDNCRIEVQCDGYDAVEAVTTIPYPTTLGDYEVTFQKSADYYYDEPAPHISITLHDPADEANYYELEVIGHSWVYESHYEIVNDDWTEVVTDSSYFATQIYIQSDDPVLTENFSWYGNSIFFDDHLINGKNYKLIFYLDPYIEYDTQYDSLFVNLKTLSKELYLYRNTYRKQVDANENPFAQPVQVYSNIDGGFGIFGGYSNFRKSIKIPREGK